MYYSCIPISLPFYSLLFFFFFFPFFLWSSKFTKSWTNQWWGKPKNKKKKGNKSNPIRESSLFYFILFPSSYWQKIKLEVEVDDQKNKIPKGIKIAE
jgi:hypothetical protein